MTTNAKKTAFVVDDEKVIADTLALILKQNDYDAMPFYSGQSAMQAGEIFSPELLISDVAMPGLSGIYLAIYFRNRYPNCRVLLFSGHANTADLQKEAEEKGHYFEILNKPIHPTDLMKRLRGPENGLTTYSSVLEDAPLVKEAVK